MAEVDYSRLTDRFKMIGLVPNNQNELLIHKINLFLVHQSTWIWIIKFDKINFTFKITRAGLVTDFINSFITK